MFIYYLYFFTLNIFNYFNILKPNKYNKSIFVFFALFIALLGGLRSLQTGFDNWAYIDYFNNNHEIDFKDTIPFLVDNMEIGYFFINIFLKNIGLNSQFILLLPSLFCISTFIFLVTRLKNNYLFVLVAYVSFVIVHNHFSIVRQSISVGITYLALAYYISGMKKYKIFILFLTAFFIHASSIIYFFIFLTSLIFNKYLRVFKYICMILFIFSFFRIDLAFYLTNYLIGIDFISVISAKYYDYNQIVYNPGFNFYFYLLYNLILLFTTTKVVILENKEYLIINLVVISTFFLMLSMTLAPSNYILWSRISLVTTIIQSFYISIYLSRLKLFNRVVLSTFILLIYHVFFIFNILSYSYGLSPYKSVINDYFDK